MVSWWTTCVSDELRTIDLNADIGEARDDEGTELERVLLRLVTSAHIACGGHAGDEESMRAMVQAALASGVRVGAHPSFPDRSGFGRVPLEMGSGELSSALAEQIGTLVEVAASLGTHVQSVKPHGALYEEVGRGTGSCEALINVIHDLCDPNTALVIASGTPAVARAEVAGLSVQQEGFADRAYRSDGGLVPRQVPGSVYSQPSLAAAQALGLAAQGTVRAEDGTVLSLRVDTLCVHGDSPNAVAMAQAVRAALAEGGIVVVGPMTPGR